MDHPYLKTSTNESNVKSEQGNQGYVGPLEAISGVHNNSPQTSVTRQISPNRGQNTSIGYKKTSQSPTLTMANPNRYSYMMAVNTHPVPMKEHRL